MGKKSIMKMLLRISLFQLLYVLTVILIFILSLVVLNQSGRIYSPNQIGKTVQELIERIENDSISFAEIPDYIEYARISKEETYLERTIKDDELIEQVIREGQVAKLRWMNGVTYRYIYGKNENWVLGYRSANAQFSNEFLRRLFPSADLAMAMIFIIVIILGFWIILKIHKNSLSKELNKITNIENTILSDDYDISKVNSNIKEVDEILTVLENMERLVKTSMRKQWQQSQLLENGIQALTHDIQTPATVVLGNIELLEETETDEKQKEYIQYAKDGICRITAYVAELKTLSKLEKVERDKSSFHKKFVEELILIAREIASLKDITILVESKEIADLAVYRSDVSKAFQNIVSNAVEASPFHSVVRINFLLSDSDYIVSVSDQGKGFTKEGLKNGANKFYSENKARNDTHYGLGLSIVKGVMKEHSGEVVMENIISHEQVTGAKVSLVFPLLK